MAASELDELIRTHRACIGIVGCGYVGLPLSQAFAEAGFKVVGLDTDRQRVESMNRGESHILDVPSEQLQRNLASGAFRATTDYSLTGTLDVVFISVPTPFDRAKEPDLSFIRSAATSIAGFLRPGQLIVLESTTFPGTTDEVLRPLLEASGLRAGSDFFLAFSPERIDPGNRVYNIHNTAKVVGGVDSQSTALAVLALQQVVAPGGVHAVSSARAAELSKLLENTFRAVNIALVNELAMLCDRMRIDLWEVIDAAATKPYGFMPFYPGPGVGGHCIPVDPYYLSWKAREYDFHTKFVELAAETNLEMPFFIASRIRRLISAHGKGSQHPNVLVIGAAFKPDVNDARNSAAIRVIEILRADHLTVEYHDPYAKRIVMSSTLFGASRDSSLDSVPLTKERVAAADCVAILVKHSGVDYDMVQNHAALVFDAVNATRQQSGSAIVERL